MKINKNITPDVICINPQNVSIGIKTDENGKKECIGFFFSAKNNKTEEVYDIFVKLSLDNFHKLTAEAVGIYIHLTTPIEDKKDENEH
jgi:hypothetical protein